MRKCHFFFTMFLLFFVISLSAQLRVGVEAGLNFTNLIRIDDNNSSLDADIRTGFRAGLNAELPLAKDFSFQPALLFVTKGFRKGWLTEMNAEAYYVEVPLNVAYKMKLGIGKLVVGAGPYFAYGTGGKWNTPQRWVGNGSGNTLLVPAMTGNLEFTNDASNDNYHTIAPGSNVTYGKPLDYGVNGLVGYELFDRLSVRINAEYGVANLAPKIEGQKTKNEIRNSGVSLSIGYYIF